jgi:hypothetical protein
MPLGQPATNFKTEILSELRAVGVADIRDTASAVARIEVGDFDATIADFEAISVTDAADLILDITAMRDEIENAAGR